MVAECRGQMQSPNQDPTAQLRLPHWPGALSKGWRSPKRLRAFWLASNLFSLHPSSPRHRFDFVTSLITQHSVVSCPNRKGSCQYSCHWCHMYLIRALQLPQPLRALLQILLLPPAPVASFVLLPRLTDLCLVPKP